MIDYRPTCGLASLLHSGVNSSLRRTANEVTCPSVRAILLIYCTVTLVLTMAWPCEMQANEIAIVVPNEFADVEGPSGGSNLPGIGFRSQTIFSSEEFASLPESHRLITTIAFRPNASVTEPRTSNWGEALWSLSTTTRAPTDMSEVFSENHGPDQTVVYDGPLVLTTKATGPPDGPRGFDYVVALQTPFFYDPSQGNLAIDFTLPSGFTPSPLDDQAVRPDAWLVDFPLSDSTSGALRGNQLIMQLTFVPEPSTFAAISLGLAAILMWGGHWRRWRTHDSTKIPNGTNATTHHHRLVFPALFAVFVGMFIDGAQGETIVEDFSDGNIEDSDPLLWTTASARGSGSFGIDNGALFLEATPNTSIGVLTEDLDLSDMSVRAKMRFEPNSQWGGIQIRSSRSGSSGYNIWTTGDGTTIWLWEQGGRGEIANMFPPTAPGAERFTAQRDFFIQVDAIGDDVKIWAWNAENSMPETPLIEESLDTYDSGRVMLWVGDTGGPNSTRAFFDEVIISDVHIPEPSTLVLAVVAGLLSISSLRKLAR